MSISLEDSIRFLNLVRKVTLKLEKLILRCLKENISELVPELTECVNEQDFQALCFHSQGSGAKTCVLEVLFTSFSIPNEFVVDFLSLSLDVHAKYADRSLVPIAMLQDWYGTLRVWSHYVPSELNADMNSLDCIADYKPPTIVLPKLNEFDLSAQADLALQLMVDHEERSGDISASLLNEANEELFNLAIKQGGEEDDDDYPYQHQHQEEQVIPHQDDGFDSNPFSLISLLTHTDQIQALNNPQCTPSSFPPLSLHTPFISHLMLIMNRYLSDALILESSASSDKAILISDMDNSIMIDTSLRAAAESASPSLISGCLNEILELVNSYSRLMDLHAIIREIANMLLLCGTHVTASYVSHYLKLFGLCRVYDDDENLIDDAAVCEKRMRLEGAVRKRCCHFLTAISSVLPSYLNLDESNCQLLSTLYTSSIKHHLVMLPVFIHEVPVPKWDQLNWVVCVSSLALLNCISAKKKNKDERNGMLTHMITVVCTSDTIELEEKLEVVWSVLDVVFGIEVRCNLPTAMMKSIKHELSRLEGANQFRVFHALLAYLK